MPNNHFSRKERQLKNHILKLEILLNINNGFLNSKIQNLIFKIKELVNLLKDILSFTEDKQNTIVYFLKPNIQNLLLNYY